MQRQASRPVQVQTAQPQERVQRSQPVPLDPKLFQHVGGGLPKGTWCTTDDLSLPKGTW